MVWVLVVVVVVVVGLGLLREGRGRNGRLLLLVLGGDCGVARWRAWRLSKRAASRRRDLKP